MTDKKITQLGAALAAIGADLLAIVTDVGDTPDTENITVTNFISSIEDALEAAFTGKKTVFLPVNCMTPTTTNGCAPVAQDELTADQPEIIHMAFDGTAIENALFYWSFPKGWDEGEISYMVYWTGLVAGAGGVAWLLKARAISNDDAIDQAYGVAVKVSDTFLLAEDLHISGESTPVTIGGTPIQGDGVWFNIERDPTDGDDTRNGVDANLIGIKIFYTIDAIKDD